MADKMVKSIKAYKIVESENDFIISWTIPTSKSKKHWTKHIKEYNNILEQFEFDIQIDYHKDILEERLPTESNTIKTNTFYHLKQPSFYDVMTNDMSEHLIENDFGLNEHRLTTLLIENVKSRNRKPRILAKVFRNKHSTISFYRDDNQLEASGYIGQCGQCFIY